MTEDTRRAPRTFAGIPMLDRILALTVIALMSLVATLLVANLLVQHRTYVKTIDALLADGGYGSYVSILAFTRGLDFAVVKTSVIFIGFLLGLVGALYVLRIAEQAFSLTIDAGEKGKAALRTASPGLVILTLGVVTVNVAVLTSSFVTIDADRRNLPELCGPRPPPIHPC